jgi:filamentous hemagglutinin family protein
MLRSPFQSSCISTIALTLGLTIVSSVKAEIIPDRTLPVNSRVTAGCVVCEINGGTTRGTNLFHSFSSFSIPTNGSAYFNNAPQIQTIFTRVTGNQISNIDGLIRNNGSASLFLMNPNGIVFGPNASLNLGGSFVGTTANAIGFGQSETFSASNPDTPPLLTIAPSALIFSQGNRGSIVNRSVTPLVGVPDGFNPYGLQVPIGQSLTLVGGNIRMEGGGLSAPGGRIEIGGLGAAGRIELENQGDGLRLIFPTGILRSNVSLTNKALISVPLSGGGAATIHARNVEIVNSVIRGGIEWETIATKTAGDIVINATETIQLRGEETDINNNVRFGGVGDAGKIILNTGSLSAIDDVVLRSVIFGQGNSGDVLINARDSIVFDDSNLVTGSLAQGRGNAGITQIKTGSLSLINGSEIDSSSAGQGNGGDISIQASGAIELISERDNRILISSGIGKGTVGNGGNISIISQSLLLKNGILRSNVLGLEQAGGVPEQGNAGNIILDIQDAISIEGLGSGVNATLGFTAKGNAGEISINAGSLIMNDGSVRNTSFGIGNAGNISIQIKNNIVLSNTSSVSGSVINPFSLGSAVGNSGEIQIRSKSLILNDNSFIDTQVNGKGNAGNLFINADILQLNDSGISATQMNGGTAGSIRIDARDGITIQGRKAYISSILFSGEGRGGDITINTQNLSLVDSLGITSYTQGNGDAGNIHLNIGNRLLVKNSSLLSGPFSTSLTSGAGKGGEINIKAGSLFLTDGGQLIASTFGKGRSGNITINAKEGVSIAGDKPSSIAVESTSSGLAGDLLIKTPRLTIADRSSLSAGSNAGNGGNINLILGELLLLRRGGTIRTNAGTPTTFGNGGNIDITMPNGLIAAVLSEDSDISANAYSGKGGKINITAQGIYGIQFQPQLTAFSDITASSTLGLSGEVNLTTPNVDPSRSLVQLPVGLVDPTNKIDRRCSPKAPQRSSSFTITGTGGIPTSPIEALQQQSSLMELVPLPNTEPSPELSNDRQSQTIPIVHKTALVEAQGLQRNQQGELWLVAEGPPANPIAPPDCSNLAAKGSL